MQKFLPPGTPRPDDSRLVAGSMVFTPPPTAVPLTDAAAWWRYVPGANWRHPNGPASSLDGRDQHPVVHVSWDDAAAYAGWAGKRMAGNVWEWCHDWYRPDQYERVGRVGLTENPPGPPAGYDPADPHAPKRVTRGGSFLCHASYCESYRPAARRGTPPDTGMSHIGFRCVVTPAMWDEVRARPDA